MLRLFPIRLFCLALFASIIACDTAEVPEVEVEDLREGDGRAAEVGLVVTVHYAGWVADPPKQVFSTCTDTTLQRQLFLGNPPPGQQSVIEGWNRGVPGMRKGGIRKLNVPPALAWGSDGAGCDDNGENCLIPPNEAVVFAIELIDVSHPDSVPPIPSTQCPEELLSPPDAL